MARTPFTLAAAVSAVTPDAGIVAVAPLTEGGVGRVQTVRATLSDGRHIVIRVPAAEDAADELRAEIRALRALTPGVRALLPFAAPELLGEVVLDGDTAVVTSFIDGYRVDPAHVPGGPGVATTLAAALAALHALPVTWVRDAGLVVRSADQVRDDAARLTDRAESTRRMPQTLLSRWRRALAADELWQFEPAVVLGGASSSSFFLEDLDGVPTVTAVAHWHGLAVGDPAIDLQWLASSPAAATDVFEAYAAGSTRAPDGMLRTRARLHAELEFASWLVHGHDTADEGVLADAESLLSALADSVGGEDLVSRAPSGVDDAVALLDRMPDTTTSPADTSMHTDAYDPEELATWLPAATASGEDGSAPRDDGSRAEAGAQDTLFGDTESGTGEPGGTELRGAAPGYSDVATAPIDLPSAGPGSPFDADDGTDADEPARAARAAFQRWASSPSE